MDIGHGKQYHVHAFDNSIREVPLGRCQTELCTCVPCISYFRYSFLATCSFICYSIHIVIVLIVNIYFYQLFCSSITLTRDRRKRSNGGTTKWHDYSSSQ